MRTVIYSRVSTDTQECSNQTIDLLKRYPDAEVIEEVVSGAKDKPKLEGLLDSLNEGDTIVVAALDRIGRSIRDVLSKMQLIQDKGIILVSVREGLDLTTPIGRFSMTIVAAVAQLERELISERTKLALQARKARGFKLGRPAEITKKQWLHVEALHELNLTGQQIENITKISKSSINVYLRRKHENVV